MLSKLKLESEVVKWWKKLRVEMLDQDKESGFVLIFMKWERTDN